MRKKRAKKVVFKSMREFESRYLPASLAKRLAEKPQDAQAAGASLAKESLDKVTTQLSV